MIGFGGAFTDAAGENLNTSSPELREHLLKSYFGPEGLEYTIARVPIGGTDFSSRAYSYCDGADGDIDLNCFDLQDEDWDLKVSGIIDSTGL